MDLGRSTGVMKARPRYQRVADDFPAETNASWYFYSGTGVSEYLTQTYRFYLIIS